MYEQKLWEAEENAFFCFINEVHFIKDKYIFDVICTEISIKQ